jgi:hypothetical protein
MPHPHGSIFFYALECESVCDDGQSTVDPGEPARAAEGTKLPLEAMYPGLFGSSSNSEPDGPTLAQLAHEIEHDRAARRSDRVAAPRRPRRPRAGRMRIGRMRIGRAPRRAAARRAAGVAARAAPAPGPEPDPGSSNAPSEQRAS